MNVSVAGGGKVIFAGGLLKLLDDHGKPMLHDQQVQLFKEGEAGEGEPSALLMVGIAHDGADDDDAKSHSSKRSKRSDRKARKKEVRSCEERSDELGIRQLRPFSSALLALV